MANKDNKENIMNLVLCIGRFSDGNMAKTLFRYGLPTAEIGHGLLNDASMYELPDGTDPRRKIRIYIYQNLAELNLVKMYDDICALRKVYLVNHITIVRGILYPNRKPPETQLHATIKQLTEHANLTVTWSHA